MCLGMTAQVVERDGADVVVRSDDRLLRASLLAVGDEVRPGDWVLVHAGFVLGVLSEQEAAETRALRAAAVAEGERS